MLRKIVFKSHRKLSEKCVISRSVPDHRASHREGPTVRHRTLVMRYEHLAASGCLQTAVAADWQCRSSGCSIPSHTVEELRTLCTALHENHPFLFSQCSSSRSRCVRPRSYLRVSLTDLIARCDGFSSELRGRTRAPKQNRTMT